MGYKSIIPNLLLTTSEDALILPPGAECYAIKVDTKGPFVVLGYLMPSDNGLEFHMINGTNLEIQDAESDDVYRSVLYKVGKGAYQFDRVALFLDNKQVDYYVPKENAKMKERVCEFE
jgi:hypothetical protein